MNQKFFIWLTAVMFSISTSAPAQGLFRVVFRASSKGLNQPSQLVETTITERDIVSEALIGHGLPPTASGDYLLVYNSTNDSLQIVNNSSGAVLTDVIEFEGGAAVSDDRQAVRFTFMFLPAGVTAFGSAYISESPAGTVPGNANERARLTARLQFALTGGQTLGGSNPLPVATTNLTATNVISGATAPSVNAAGLAINGASGGANLLGTALNPEGETDSLALMPPEVAGNANGPAVTATTNSSAASALAIGSSPSNFLSTASLSATNSTNVRIFTGNFAAGRRFLPTAANFLPGALSTSAAITNQ